MTAMFDLAGRVALVTGGNGGIGLAMARALSEAGARIMIHGRSREKNARAVEGLPGLGAEAATVEADLRDEAGCRATVRAAAERFGRLDVLVNNVGMNIRKLPQDYSAAEWHEVVDTNLTSAFLCSREAYPHMVRAGRGKVIMTGSMATLFGGPQHAAYAASKGGVAQLAKSLATAWASDNIQVNVVLPGFVDTDFTRGARRDIPNLSERVLARTPAGRWGTVEDIAGVAVFLASRASDFVTGALIPVDGGFSAAM